MYILQEKDSFFECFETLHFFTMDCFIKLISSTLHVSQFVTDFREGTFLVHGKFLRKRLLGEVFQVPALLYQCWLV